MRPVEFIQELEDTTFRESQDLDSPFAAEYFGGLLASARQKDSDDDSAVPFLKVLEGLSARQIRLHFITHYLFSKHQIKSLPEKMQFDFWNEVGLKIELDAVKTLFGSGPDIQSDLTTQLQQMADAGILGAQFTFVSEDRITGCRASGIDRHGLYISFSRVGLQLFLRALGQSGNEPNALPYLDVDYSISSELRPELSETRTGVLFRLPLSSTPKAWDERLEELQSESEMNIDEANSAVESLKDEVAEVRNALASLHGPGDSK